jgi:hypothetical protein
MTDEKAIIIKPNKPPQFVGDWTMGEVVQILRSFEVLINNIPISAIFPKVEEGEEA